MRKRSEEATDLITSYIEEMEHNKKEMELIRQQIIEKSKEVSELEETMRTVQGKLDFEINK